MSYGITIQPALNLLNAGRTTAVYHIPLLTLEDSVNDNWRARDRSTVLQHTFCHYLSSHYISALDHIPHNNADAIPKPAGRIIFTGYLHSTCTQKSKHELCQLT